MGVFPYENSPLRALLHLNRDRGDRLLEAQAGIWFCGTGNPSLFKKCGRRIDTEVRRRRQIDYLVNLACADADAAHGLVSQIVREDAGRQVLVSTFARALRDAEASEGRYSCCDGIKALTDEDKKLLTARYARDQAASPP